MVADRLFMFARFALCLYFFPPSHSFVAHGAADMLIEWTSRQSFVCTYWTSIWEWTKLEPMSVEGMTWAQDEFD